MYFSWTAPPKAGSSEICIYFVSGPPKRKRAISGLEVDRAPPFKSRLKPPEGLYFEDAGGVGC